MVYGAALALSWRGELEKALLYVHAHDYKDRLNNPKARAMKAAAAAASVSAATANAQGDARPQAESISPAVVAAALAQLAPPVAAANQPQQRNPSKKKGAKR